MAPKARGPKRGAGQTSRNWVFGWRSSPFLVEEPKTFRPHLLMLIDVGSGRMIDMEPVEPDPSPEALAKWAGPRIEDGVTVRVESEELAAPLRARLAGRADVVVADTPEVDDAIASLEEYTESRRSGPRPDPDWKDEVSEAVKAGFYEAAAAFEKSEPWQQASDGHVMAFEAPAAGWPSGIAVVMGHGGESFGLTLFRSPRDYEGFVRLADDPAARRRPGPGVALLAVHLDDPRLLPGGRKLVAEAKAHGFVAGPSGRYPFILNSNADHVPIRSTEEDYRVAIACLTAVRQFVGAQRALFEAPPTTRVRMSSRIVMPDGDVEVTVEAPPADLPWRWGEEEPFEGIRRRDREALLSGFRAAREAEGVSSSELDADAVAAEEMLEFKQQAGGSLVDWSAEEVSAFLLDHYPLRGATTGAEVEGLPARFAAFLAWLASSGRGRAGKLAAARARLAELKAAFVDAARDERRYGPAKLLAEHVRREGIDVTDKQAFDASVRRFNERLAKDPALLPMLGGARSRWVWDGQGAPPDPRGPCPCGSGRRYRKCCMPR